MADVDGCEQDLRGECGRCGDGGCQALREEPHCRRGVPGCECDYHSPDWIAFCAEYGIELPEVDEVCKHHRQQEVRRG